MFTGLIDHCGIIREINRTKNALHAIIECTFSDLIEGESIAVDGICLTAIHPQATIFAVDISPETLQLTTAEQFVPGNKVNLERALRMGDRLGGHWVTGHVDQRATAHKIISHQDFVELQITGVAKEAMPYLVKKGSIAVNGVSLTINEVLPEGFQVFLIPHTLQRTNLQILQEGSLVNLEFDFMAKTIFKQLEVYFSNLRSP